MRWRDCLDCQHVFIEGYFSEQACQLIFSKTHDNQRVGFNLETNRVVSARMIDRVLPFASGGAWLDIGFGNGSLLITAQEYGFKPIGVDLRADNVALMNTLGVQAHCQDMAQLKLDEECSVISMMDVLEHMPFPGLGLTDAYRLLRQDGVLFLSMPNSDNLLWRLMTEQNVNPYMGELEHFHNFSRSRLYQLLMEHGFAPVRYGVSERYRVCMEVVAVKTSAPVLV